MKLRKPTPDPPRPWNLPGPGTSPGPGLASRVRAGPELGACSGPWVRRRPHHRAVRVLVPVPVLSFASVLHAGAGCAPARGRRRESLRARSRRESGHRLAPRPRRRTGAAGETPRGRRRGCHLDPRRPQGVRTRSVRVGPGAAVADADRAQGECGPGKVVQRAHGGALLFGQLAFRWTTAVRPSFSSAKCTSRRPGRSGVGRRGPRDRRVTRENVT